MKYKPWKLQAGYAGLGLAAVVACTAAGFSLLFPVLLGAGIYAARRWSPIDGYLEKKSYERLTKDYAELPPGHPLHDRVAAIAARMDSPMPRVFLAPPRVGDINVYTVGHVNRRSGEGGLLVLPASLYTVTCPGRPSVFTAEEQDAVIAHEMSHIRHNDSRTMVAMNTAQKITFLGYAFAAVGGLLGVIATGPLWIATGALLGSMAMARMCSRQVEYRADAEAVEASGNALALATALEKLNKTGRHLQMFAQNTQDMARDDGKNGWIAVFRGRKVDQDYEMPEPSPMAKLFMRYLSTHPEHSLRYDHLRARAQEEGQAELPVKAPSVEKFMAEHLLRTEDGIILPPFAIKETIVRDMGTGQIAVATGITSAFNAAARGEETPTLRRPPVPSRHDQPSPPGP